MDCLNAPTATPVWQRLGKLSLLMHFKKGSIRKRKQVQRAFDKRRLEGTYFSSTKYCSKKSDKVGSQPRMYKILLRGKTNLKFFKPATA